MNTNFAPIQQLGLLEQLDRLISLKAAISRAVKPGDYVLDAGCGTGILGMMALDAGANKVVAVDSHDLKFAEDLATKNNKSEFIEFIQTDLSRLDPDQTKQFDVILAMIYSGHPILDEQQVLIKNKLVEKFLKPGGTLIPNRIKWYVQACDWPMLDMNQGIYRVEQAITRLSNHIGIEFDMSWAQDISRIQAWNWVIDSSVPYEFARNFGPMNTDPSEWKGARLLSRRALLADFEYGKSRKVFPETFTVEINEPGRITNLIWTRELWFGDAMISARNSISLVKQPFPVRIGDRSAFDLTPEWRKTNIIST